MKLFNFLLFALILFALGCGTPKPVVPAIDYSATSPVNFQLEEGSTLIKKTYHESLEKTTDGTFIYKKYYPTTSVITHQITFLDEKKEILQGAVTHRFDNGAISLSGNYTKNEKDGEWKYFHFPAGNLKSIGNYKNGQFSGTWTDYNSDSTKICQYSYNEAGKLHGDFTYWTKNGEIKEILTYDNGEVIKTKTYQQENDKGIFQIVDQMPIFGKECIEMTDKKAAKACGEKALLMAIYKSIQYPTFARQRNIEGTAVISFVIEKDGRLTDIQVLHGICDEIRAECIRVVETLSPWTPGYQNNEAVRVQFNLPIRFRLE